MNDNEKNDSISRIMFSSMYHENVIDETSGVLSSEQENSKNTRIAYSHR